MLEATVVLTYVDGRVKLTVFRRHESSIEIFLSETGLANLAEDAVHIMAVMAQERARA